MGYSKKQSVACKGPAQKAWRAFQSTRMYKKDLSLRKKLAKNPKFKFYPPFQPYHQVLLSRTELAEVRVEA